MFGGGGMNPRKMKQMMEQMGIEVTELDATEVVVRLDDEELVFDGPQVTRMDAQGQQTYQVIGEPESRSADEAGGADATSGTAAADDAADAAADEDAAIPDADVELVAERAGVSEEEAREALAAESGDLAAAVSRLSD